MTYFLENIAQNLYTVFGNTLNKHCLVFPNRRAGLYFLKYLAARIDKPVWVPSILTINELLASYSDLQTAGNEILLFELYKVYVKLNPAPESFDEFYFWGDMLLNDFDDVDKYLVDASLLFRNVRDIKEIDELFGELTEEQIGIIRRFWVNFHHDKPSGEKKGFISLWSLLHDLYIGLRSSLKSRNIAYEGMIFRETAEINDSVLISATSWDIVHFIGFNALNDCEKAIMTKLKKAGKARFYWDYDNSYINESKLNSAGFFMRDNLKQFGNDMSSEWAYDTLLYAGSSSARRRVIEASSDVAQVKLLQQLLREIPDLTQANAHHTAVVLADENLLMPVLTSLPDNLGDINITMGHPLKHTLVYTFVKHLMDIQRSTSTVDGILHFSHRDVHNILKHPLIEDVLNEPDRKLAEEISESNMAWIPGNSFDNSETLKVIFTKASTPSLLSAYLKEILSSIAIGSDKSKDLSESNTVNLNIRNEFIFRIVLSLNRLESIIRSSEINFTTDTYLRILDRMLRSQSVPFSGEPLTGIQVMGILETRTLDFKNLIILSVNEGVMPSVTAGSSFIPFSLREAFGLPSVNHQESIYAYHFYRLLQRAENVTFTYNSNSEGLRSGEMSRFLIQMNYEPSLKPDFTNLTFEIKTADSINEKVERNENHQLQLFSRFLTSTNGMILSPSAINTWLNCRMKFYYRYINRLTEPQKITSDIDPAMLGIIFHELLKKIYLSSVGKTVSEEYIISLMNDQAVLHRITDEAIRDVFGNKEGRLPGGNELIVKDVLMTYLGKVLDADRSISPFTILNLEDSFSFKISVSSNNSHYETLVGGKVDRIDKVNESIRIVDYKTGAVADAINSVDDLFVDDRKKDADGWLQTLIYCEAYLNFREVTNIYPSIYKIKKLTGSTFSDKLKIKENTAGDGLTGNYITIRDQFMNGLAQTVNTIFSAGEPFTMTKDVRGKCSYCPYRDLCLR